MEQIFSLGERWNVLFNLTLPHWMKHFIFHLMKIFVPLHSWTFIICKIFVQNYIKLTQNYNDRKKWWYWQPPTHTLNSSTESCCSLKSVLVIVVFSLGFIPPMSDRLLVTLCVVGFVFHADWQKLCMMVLSVNIQLLSKRPVSKLSWREVGRLADPVKTWW